MLTQCRMLTTEIIGRTESLYFVAGRKKAGIDLGGDIEGGRLGILSASTQDFVGLYSVFSRQFIDVSLHAGEAEALAVIRAGKAKEALFCSGDGLAIQGLAMLGAESAGISLERLLRMTGFRVPALERWYTETYFKGQLTQGKLNLLASTGTAERGG